MSKIFMIAAAIAAMAVCSSAEAKFSFKPTSKPSGGAQSGKTPAKAPAESDDDDGDDEAPKAKAKVKADKRVKAALEEEMLKFTVKDSGVFSLSFSWNTEDDGERSHVVFISSRTSTLDGMEIRDIWAYGCNKKSLSRKELADLLMANEKYKIGAWGVIKTGGKESAVFTAKVPADLSGSELRAVAFAVALGADEMEKKLDGGVFL